MRRRSNLAPGQFSRLNRVMGRVVSAKGLPKSERFSKCDPYVVIKGIRSSNHLSNVHVTSVIPNSYSPEWNEEFDFHVPGFWGIVELVGLRLMLFDADEGTVSFQGSDDFLGGCDVDLSDAVTGRTVTHDIELGGVPAHKIRGGHKPRVSIVLTVYRETIPKPTALSMQLGNSVRHITYVREVVGRVIAAANLKNTDLLSVSDPVCIVRTLLISGEMREIGRTGIVDDSLNPCWDMDFRMTFELTDQPLLIIFDIFDSDDPNELPEDTGEHLGTAVIPLLQCMPPHPRRRSVFLQGTSQRHETRLNREGLPLNDLGRSTASIVGVTGPDTGPETPYERLQKFGKSIKDRIKGLMGDLKSEGRSYLTVELRTRTKKEVMPHIALVDKAVDIADEEDVKQALAHPDWERGMFEPPVDLQLAEGVRPQRGLLQAQERIVFIYGSTLGASGLLRVVPSGRDNPYVIVEGVTRTAEKCFIHRTRIIRDTFCPEWLETFYFAVPKHLEISRLIFTVYHATGEPGSPDEAQDEFLGRASLDLAYLVSGDIISEDIPISGATSKHKVKVSNGFRRSTTLSVEVLLERRVRPTFGNAIEETLSKVPRRKYLLSREPMNGRAFQDCGQQIIPALPEEEAAEGVSEKCQTGQLMPPKQDIFNRGKQRGWSMEPPESDAPTQKELEDTRVKREKEFEILQERLMREKRDKLRRLNAGAHGISQEQLLNEGSNFTIKYGIRRPRSLPDLKSKFGVDQKMFLADMTDAGGGRPESLHISFHDKAQNYVTSAFKNLLHQPGHTEVLMRGRPGTAPEQFFKLEKPPKGPHALYRTLPAPTR
eukprot:TRINITY_DN26862_c0_g1_i1.p1 TRINITY_DN26862_c0_g1~~TRINITY_DN26862_c0_g1_i1.p1  ORF type:complete len:825 (+),score=96.53 TRINITY_DN26862_c0_g1_i1:173-2647(+)